MKVFNMMIESYVQCVFWACVRWGVECGGRTVCVWGEKKLRGQGWHGRPLPRFICIFRNSLSSHQCCSTGRGFHENVNIHLGREYLIIICHFLKLCCPIYKSPKGNGPFDLQM